jgi:XTP/dITP diphosphohydrolase
VKILFASHNPDKIRELENALQGLPLEVASARDYPDLIPPEESGTTLEENALLKARAAHQATGQLCLADDTGLEVEALNGAPGVHSARYAGPEQSYRRNLEKLAREMAAVAAGRRAARFRTAVALLFPDGSEWVVEGVCEGEIATAARGDGGFGYDPLFYLPELDKTFAEMSLSEKQSLSHRGRAMRKARAMLEAWLEAATAAGP